MCSVHIGVPNDAAMLKHNLTDTERGALVSATWYLTATLVSLLILAGPLILRWSGLRGWQFAGYVEDGLVESFGALCALVASVIFVCAYIETPRATADTQVRRRNPWLLLLALAALVAAGEEISWGQRLLGFETPAWLAEKNVQDEFNFHNVIFTDPDAPTNPSEILMLATLLGYLGVLPLLTRRSARLWQLVARTRLPVPSTALLRTTWILVVASSLAWWYSGYDAWQVSEAVETVGLVLILVLALEVFAQEHQQPAFRRRLPLAATLLLVGPVAIAMAYQGSRLDLANAAQEYSKLPTALASARTDEGRFEEAVELYSEALQIWPENVAALTGRAHAFLQLEATQRALTDAHNALALEPDNVAARMVRGLVLTKSQDYAGAIDDFSAIVALEPENAAALAHRGFAHLLLGNDGAAGRDFEASIKLDSVQGEAIALRVGVLRWQQGRLSEAAQHFEEVLRLNPDNLNAHRCLAEVRRAFRGK